MDQIEKLPIDATMIGFIEELEKKTAPGQETVLPLVRRPTAIGREW